MIDHVGVRVMDLRASAEFYRTALAPLGHEVLRDFDYGVGLGQSGKSVKADKAASSTTCQSGAARQNPRST